MILTSAPENGDDSDVADRRKTLSPHIARSQASATGTRFLINNSHVYHLRVCLTKTIVQRTLVGTREGEHCL